MNGGRTLHRYLSFSTYSPYSRQTYILCEEGVFLPGSVHLWKSHSSPFFISHISTSKYLNTYKYVCMLLTYPTLLLLYITYLEITRRCGIGGKPYFLTAILTAGPCFINILHHDYCLTDRSPIASGLSASQQPLVSLTP